MNLQMLLVDRSIAGRKLQQVAATMFEGLNFVLLLPTFRKATLFPLCIWSLKFSNKSLSTHKNLVIPEVSLSKLLLQRF